jgi:hypothetical protein
MLQAALSFEQRISPAFSCSIPLLPHNTCYFSRQFIAQQVTLWQVKATTKAELQDLVRTFVPNDAEWGSL